MRGIRRNLTYANQKYGKSRIHCPEEVEPAGFEPATFRVQGGRSPN
jgi:hypothetical protein